MSFLLSFHQALLGPTGAHWLDDRSDLSCKESTRQYPAVPRCLLNSRLGFESPRQFLEPQVRRPRPSAPAEAGPLVMG
jgi:hypothetical protein